MVHARLVRPPTTGARVVSVDKNSVSKVSGLIDVVVKKDYVAVVAETEWAAIQGATQLKVTWSKWAGGVAAGMPRTSELYKVIRTLPRVDQLARNDGNVDAGLASAAKVVNATYVNPYNIHGPIGPPAAVADVRPDRAVVYSGSQSIFGMRAVIAKLLNLPEANVRFIFYATASAFGSSNADDCAVDACLLSQAVGRPVRVQYMGHDDHVWAGGRSVRLTDIRAGLDGPRKDRRVGSPHMVRRQRSAPVWRSLRDSRGRLRAGEDRPKQDDSRHPGLASGLRGTFP
jgi:nicotinate dehydrogenase subunit B